MKICHISTYADQGGAGRAALRLHQGLLTMGEESRFLVKHADMYVDGIAPLFEEKRSFLDKIYGRMRHLQVTHTRKRTTKHLAPYQWFSDDRSRFVHGFKNMQWDCDVIHLHWVSNDFFDYEGFFSTVPANIPVVWTLHDMNPFTGGCHYDGGCGRYREACGACPMLGGGTEDRGRRAEDGGQRDEDRGQRTEDGGGRAEDGGRWANDGALSTMDQGPRTKIDEHDLSRRIWERKEQAIRGALRRGVNLHIVAPSRWLADCARASSLFRELPVSVIPYGLDANLFKPCDGRGVRDALGIAPNERMILFVAQGIQDKRKGFGLLLEALSEVEMECAVKLVGIGHAQAAFRSRCKLPVVFTGTIENDAIMTMLYSAADVFVIPSLQDNLPNTVLESMACGTPVIGFDAGGIQDMVRQGETGILVPAGDCHSLSSAIISLCKNDQLRARMGSICRQVLNEKYRLAVQAQCYLDVYSSS